MKDLDGMFFLLLLLLFFIASGLVQQSIFKGMVKGAFSYVWIRQAKMELLFNKQKSLVRACTRKIGSIESYPILRFWSSQFPWHMTSILFSRSSPYIGWNLFFNLNERHPSLHSNSEWAHLSRSHRIGNYTWQTHYKIPRK